MVTDVLGTVQGGEKVHSVHIFDGERLSYSTNSFTYYSTNVLEKHVKALVDVIATWKKRVKTASNSKEAGNAQSHVDFNEDLLKQETETLITLTKGKV